MTMSLELELVIFKEFDNIELRGTKNENGLLIRLIDLVRYYNVPISYLKIVSAHLKSYSLQDIYTTDYQNINQGNYEVNIFPHYSKKHQLFITFKGLDILACNLPRVKPFRDWLKNKLEMDLNCYEIIDYDNLGW